MCSAATCLENYSRASNFSFDVTLLTEWEEWGKKSFDEIQRLASGHNQRSFQRWRADVSSLVCTVWNSQGMGEWSEGQKGGEREKETDNDHYPNTHIEWDSPEALRSVFLVIRRVSLFSSSFLVEFTGAMRYEQSPSMYYGKEREKKKRLNKHGDAPLATTSLIDYPPVWSIGERNENEGLMYPIEENDIWDQSLMVTVGDLIERFIFELDEQKRETNSNISKRERESRKWSIWFGCCFLFTSKLKVGNRNHAAIS